MTQIRHTRPLSRKMLILLDLTSSLYLSSTTLPSASLSAKVSAASGVLQVNWGFAASSWRRMQQQQQQRMLWCRPQQKGINVSRELLFFLFFFLLLFLRLLTCCLMCGCRLEYEGWHISRKSANKVHQVTFTSVYLQIEERERERYFDFSEERREHGCG